MMDNHQYLPALIGNLLFLKMMKWVLLVPCLLLIWVPPDVDCAIARVMSLERIDVKYMNPAYVVGKFVVGKYNRTTKALNVTLEFLKDVPEDAMMQFKLYKLDGGLYKETAMQLHKNLCSLLDNEYKKLLGSHLETGPLSTFIKGCPIKKGKYTVLNENLSLIRIPWLPAWSIKTSGQVYTKDAQIFDLDTYMAVKEVGS